MDLNGKRIRAPRGDDPVQICTGCGTGFLVSQPGNVHAYPVWFTPFSRSEGSCRGTIRMANRQQQINNIDAWEATNDQTEA